MFKIDDDTRQVTRKIGKQSLTMEYKPNAYSAAEQATFVNTYQMADRKCPDCGAKLPLEEVPESEKEAYRKRGHTNGHVMYTRALICSECNASVNPLQKQMILMSEWLAAHLTEADWEDSKGQIPIDADAILNRVPFSVMNTAFNMIMEDKQGKD